MDNIIPHADNAYTSASTAGVATGTGITSAANSGISIFVSIEALPFNASRAIRYRYVDLTITFNRATVNPVLHINDLGGVSRTGLGFTSELELLNPGANTLSKLSGETQFLVDAVPTVGVPQIRNGNTDPVDGLVSGSVLVTTPATGITSLTFRFYMRGNPAGPNWHVNNNTTSHSGDLVYIGVSQLTPPTANTLTNAAIIPKSNGATVLSPVLSGTTSRPASITLSSYTITTLPTSGTLTYSGGAVALGTVIPAAQIGTLSYTPVGTGFAGTSVSFTYNTTDSNGALSVGNNNTGTITAGNATYTIPLGVADVATTITGPTAVGASQPTGNFTATFSNTGTVPAASATQTVTLPTGAGLTAAQKATIVAAYPGTTFATTGTGTTAITTITFPTATLAVGASSSYVFAYTAPLTTGNYTTTSTTSTTTAENVTSNNTASTASAPLVVSAAADVTVSLTGPTTLNAGQPTGTYTATFTNEGPNPASTVTRSITLPMGASVSGAQQADLTTRYGLTAASFTTTGNGASAVTTINFGPVASLPNNATSVVTFAFTAPDAVSTTLALTGTTGTSSAGGANIALNTTSLTLATVTTADVAATITASATATIGTFNVSFGNNGPQTATGIIRTVQLPANLTGVTFTGDAALATYNASTGLVTYPGTTTTIAAGSAASGSPLTSTISYNLASSVTPATATASVSTTTNEGGIIANNTASAAMTTELDLTTTLTGPTTAVVGSPITLFVTTANAGPNTAPSATQTVTIPSAATLAGNIFITNGGTYFYDGTLKVGTVTFPALANLPGGQTVTNSISFLAPTANFAPTANVTAGGTSATVVELNTANNSANLNAGVSGTSVAVTAPVGASTNESTTIKATVGTSTTTADIVSPGSVVTYAVTSTNNGPTATTNVVEQVQLLPGLTTASLTVGGTTGTLVLGKLQFVTTNGTSSYDPATGVLTYYTVAAQAIGTTTTYDKLAVTTPASIGNIGQLLATAVVTTSQLDAVPADNTASVGVRVKTIPDLVTSIAGPSTTVAGLPATYVVKFANNGTSDAASVTETAQLPAGLSNVVVTDATGAVVPGAYNSATGLVSFPNLPTDAVGAAQSFTIVLTAPGQNFPVTSTIASIISDGTSTDNSASLATAVSPNADLAVSVTGPVVAVIGNSITYIVTTTNNGPTRATSIVTTVQLPAGLTGLSSGQGGAATDNGNGLYTFTTTASLVPGGSVINYITFTMPGPASGKLAPSLR